MIKEEYQEILKNNVATVTFLKKNGEERVMKCTLKRDLLPPSPVDFVEEEKKVLKDNPNQVNVFDLDKQAWRSFLIESVTMFDIDK